MRLKNLGNLLYRRSIAGRYRTLQHREFMRVLPVVSCFCRNESNWLRLQVRYHQVSQLVALLSWVSRQGNRIPRSQDNKHHRTFVSIIFRTFYFWAAATVSGQTSACFSSLSISPNNSMSGGNVTPLSDLSTEPEDNNNAGDLPPYCMTGTNDLLPENRLI